MNKCCDAGNRVAMRVRMTNLTRGTTVAERVEVARSLRERIVGLLSRKSLAAGEGLMFPRCASVHTIGMRFPIDVALVKTTKAHPIRQGNQPQHAAVQSDTPVHGSQSTPSSGVVLKVVQALRPNRIVWALGADTVVELPAGTLVRAATQAGDQLQWESHPAP